ncbi:phosphopantothenate-cysteine ligase [Boletus reticuloceps]|uniref:Phosphopantothenate-cysteine ligase n=1 Tax=Boletus reticuloceps TaxID=495285 RepID=A0A8I3ACJ6_9AGAM|nr:phosphopantothenate-cysteine ligase [Boletus reticuloceps]
MPNTTEINATTFSAESYFATQPEPPTLKADIQGVSHFIDSQIEKGRKVVLVTSGGTTVPLELNVVRFLDNFSAGTRGATSAEYFLKQGYAVIFMHRQFSLQPFSRNYSHSTHPFLDFLEIDAALPSSSTIDSAYPYSNDPSPSAAHPHITVKTSEKAALLSLLRAYKAVQAKGTLHTLTFVTVNDYLYLLRAISKEMKQLGPKAMYYLAAAVSDFFLPKQKMSEHKIQSGKGSLHIEMDQVPKVLKPLVSEWVPAGFVVSFKLETDPALLIPKARQALERYGHQVVIGNDLHHRKHHVVLVSPKSTASDRKILPNGVEYEEMWIEIDSSPSAPHKEIEEGIVRELVARHDAWIKRA